MAVSHDPGYFHPGRLPFVGHSFVTREGDRKPGMTRSNERTTMVCTQCGTTAADGTAVCPQCGASLSTASALLRPPQPTPVPSSPSGRRHRASSSSKHAGGRRPTGSSQSPPWCSFISLFLPWFTYKYGSAASLSVDGLWHGWMYIVLLLCLAIIVLSRHDGRVLHHAVQASHAPMNRPC